MDAFGNVYVADRGNNEIRTVSPAGVVTTLAGGIAYGWADGTDAAQFSSPAGIAVDASGYVYVADTGNNRIRKVSPTGVVTTLAGNSVFGSTDGAGTAAGFYFPCGLAVDALGNIYVADANDCDIREINPTGLVTTLAGGAFRGSADGTGRAAEFNDPRGVAVDASGNVYVADTGNNEIRKITLPPRVTPAIAWAAPAAVAEGTPLSSARLNATANVPGTSVYTPAAGTVFAAGTQTLSATFTPVEHRELRVRDGHPVS